MNGTPCTWTDGNTPCQYCPQKITALHMCKLLQDSLTPKAEQMTAKDFLNEHFKDSIPSVFDGEIWDERFIEAMNQYTLSIVEKVVTKLNNENPYKDPSSRESYSQYRQGLSDGIDSVLDEIKNEICE